MDPSMKRVHFNSLPEVTRQRLIDAVDGTGQPAPILMQKTAGAGGVVGWIIFAALLAAGGLWLLSLEYGSMYRAGQQGFEYLIGLMVISWLGTYALVAAVRRIVLDRSIPFRRGRYLFPTDLVVATDPVLKIFPLSKLTKLDPVHHYQNGVYTHTDFNFYFEGGKHETFVVRGKVQAEQALDYFHQTGYLLNEAFQNQDLNAIRSLDIFFEAQDHPSFKPDGGDMVQPAAPVTSGPKARSVPFPLKWASVTALAGLLLAVPVWMVRNYISDEAAFDQAVACGSSDCFSYYLRANGRHADEVRDTHLPRAAFQEAQEQGTVAALRDFVTEYPNSRHVAEARQVIHQRFEQVRGNFMSQANTQDTNMVAFMGDLLNFLEAHDSPPVLVRFNAPSSESLSAIDQNLPPNTSAVSPHFTAERSEARERYITQVLQRGFAAVFPNDVMRLEHRGRLAPNTPPELVHPTIDVSYVVRPSGSIYVDDTNQRQFIGIHNDFVVRMSIPNVERTHSFQLQVQPPQRFSVGYSRFGGADSGPSDGAVYTTMAERAFEQLGTQLPLVFFRQGTPAYQQAISGRAGNPPPSPPPSPLGTY